MPSEKQEQLTLPEYLSSPPVFNGFRVNWSLALCVMFCRSLLFFCPFSFDHCVVCPASIYGFWLHRCNSFPLLRFCLNKSHKQKPCFVPVSTPYVVMFFLPYCLKWKVAIRFVDVGGFFDHLCLNFLFIIYIYFVVILS